MLLAAGALAAPPGWKAVSSRTSFTFRKTAIAVLGVSGMAFLINSPGFQASAAKSEAERKAEERQSASSQPIESNEPDTPAKAIPKEEPENPYADDVRQYVWIDRGKDAIIEKLKDPDSAKFRNVRFYSGGGVPVVCGQVNAKNAFGGYTGFERFIAAGPQLAYLESEISDGIAPVWNKMCIAAPHDRASTD